MQTNFTNLNENYVSHKNQKNHETQLLFKIYKSTYMTLKKQQQNNIVLFNILFVYKKNTINSQSSIDFTISQN